MSFLHAHWLKITEIIVVSFESLYPLKDFNITGHIYRAVGKVCKSGDAIIIWWA